MAKPAESVLSASWIEFHLLLSIADRVLSRNDWSCYNPTQHTYHSILKGAIYQFREGEQIAFGFTEKTQNDLLFSFCVI